ncbi:hypothetical protein ACF0H5_008997 [Mactra antiquata]
MDFSIEDSFASRRHGRRSLQTFEAMMGAESPAVRDDKISKVFRRESTAINVQKSIQLLDESIHTPSPRGVRTPGGTLKHSSYTPRLLASGTKYDVSTRMGSAKKRTPQAMRSFQRSFQEESFQARPMMESFQEESFQPRTMMENDEDLTTTNVALLLDEDPGISASKSLFMDFLQCLRSYPSESEIFTQIEVYEKLCEEQANILKKLTQHAAKHEEKFIRTCETQNQLNKELATWKLIRTLFKDRQDVSMKEEFMMEQGEDDQPLVVEGIYQSDKKIIDSLLEREQSVREAQLIVDWLENCAQEDCENISIKFFSDRAVGIENARHRLMKQGHGLPTGAARSLITELDPDAPIRQNKLLDDLDKEDEDRLLQYIFACLRAGQLEKAQTRCIECGQAWRAASLEGWKLYNDSNFEGPDGVYQRRPVEGNPNRDIWKKVCWNMVQDPRVNTYEKAIYSVLSGNLQGILPLCHSWSDYMWAYFRVLVDRRIEDEIRLKTTISRSLEHLPGEYWEKNLTTKSVFKEIEAAEMIQREAGSIYHQIQKYIILGDIPGLIQLLYDHIKLHKEETTLHLLRFITHFILFIRSTDLHSKEDLCNSILECYVEELIKNQHYQLVAHYVSKLPSDAQIFWYAKFLEGINDKEERQFYRDLAEDSGLDIAAISKRVVENIRSKSDVDFSSLNQDSVDSSISEEDKRKIEAIDWLVFDVNQRHEALKQANALMRVFVALKKLDAAKAVFDKLPPDSVDVVHKSYLQQTGSNNLPRDDMNAIHEYLCMKAYLDAMDSFNDWIQHYHHGQPKQPEPPTGGTFTDRVAYEHRLKTYEQDHERWYQNLLMQTQTTKDHIYNVLLFPDGGWMADPSMENNDENTMDDNEDVDTKRSEQLQHLRSLTLPGLVFLLHNILHTSEQYQECLRLADMIASEQNNLYQVFREEELQRLLHLLRESSLKLLNNGKGPLGYEKK